MGILFNRKDQNEKRKQLRRDTPRAERLLWQHVRNKQIDGAKFRRQVSIGAYVADFYCPRLRIVVELDGDSHFEKYAIEYDQDRDAYMKALGLFVLRFTNHDVYHDLETVLSKIEQCIVERCRDSPPYEGGGANVLAPSSCEGGREL